jgi:hypothetical protein
MTYLTMPKENRSMMKTAEILGKSWRLMGRWAQMWSWTYRVGQYEEHYLLLKLESVEARRDEMWQAQINLAEVAVSVVMANLSALARQITDDGQAQNVKADALVRMMDTATKIQRMAVLGRIAGAAEAQERQERLAEAYSDELVELVREIENEAGLDQEQQKNLRAVLERHLAVTGQ